MFRNHFLAADRMKCYNTITKALLEQYYTARRHDMAIGAKIKQLRRGREMTQEQLAEFMNLSVSAVSQWECDKTMPDIMQLPALANIFEVSADELLGINLTKTEEKIQFILEKAHIHYAAGDFTQSAELLRLGLAEYPNSYDLMADYADSINCCGGREEEAAAVCKRILNGCTDNKLRGRAVQHLIFAYRDMGRLYDAIETAEEQMDAWFSRQDMLLCLINGDKAAALCREYGLFCLNRLAMCLETIAKEDSALSEEDKICLYSKIPVLYETYFEDGDMMYQSQFTEMAHFNLARLYAGRGDTENTLTNLESAVRYAVDFDTYDEKSDHTSAAVRGEADGGWINSDGNRTSWMLADIGNPCFDFVRDTPQFTACVDQLKRYAKSGARQ